DHCLRFLFTVEHADQFLIRIRTLRIRCGIRVCHYCLQSGTNLPDKPPRAILQAGNPDSTSAEGLFATYSLVQFLGLTYFPDMPSRFDVTEGQHHEAIAFH